jgi:hypothetical protein
MIISITLLAAISVILINDKVVAFAIIRDSRRLAPTLQTYSPFDSTRTSTGSPHCKKSATSLRGLDYEAIENDEECDFGTDPNRILPDKCIELAMPNESISPLEVVSTCMSYLQTNDEPKPDSGLEVCYNFSSDSCRAANGGSLEAFLKYANNPVFQSMVNCHEWEVLNVGPEIPGTNTRGAMKTVLIKVVQKQVEGEQRNDRRFLWTLMRERRPPRQGCFLVHECISVENAFAHTV